MRPIGFAHRGAASTRAEQNTLPAFQRAIELGAGGVETDVALTADGVPVLAHLRLVRGPRIAELQRHELPAHIPSLADLYQRCGTDFDLSLDMAQPGAVDAVMRVAAEYGATSRLWLTYWRLPRITEWRQRWPEAHLVYPTMPLPFGSSARRTIEGLAAAHIDVLNLYYRLCRRDLITTAHTHGLRVFAWGLRSAHPIPRLLARGIDGIYCDDAAGMVAALAASGGLG